MYVFLYKGTLEKPSSIIKRFQKPSEIYSICQMQDQINSNKKFMKSLSIEGELTILQCASWSQPMWPELAQRQRPSSLFCSLGSQARAILLVSL